MSTQSFIKLLRLTYTLVQIIKQNYNCNMAKNQTVTKPISIFSLTRLKAGCFYNPVSVDMTPIQKPNKVFESIVPTFNQDQKYFTPAFILPTNQDYFNANSEFQRENFEEKIRGLQEKKTNQSFEARGPSSQYCQVCRQTYERYEDHIISVGHRRNVGGNKYNKLIGQLVNKFKKANNETDVIPKTKKIEKAQKRKTTYRSKKISGKKQLQGTELVNISDKNNGITNNSSYVENIKQEN